MYTLLLTFDAGGNVPPFLTLGRVLRQRGHDVSCLGQPSLQRRFERVGVTFLPAHHCTSYDPEARLTPEQQNQTFGQVFFDEGYCADLRAELSRRRPDVVVVDCYHLSAMTTLEALGLRYVVLVHTLFGWMLKLGEVFLPLVNGTRERAQLTPLIAVPEIWTHAARTLVASSPLLDTGIPDGLPGVRFVGPIFDESSEPPPDDLGAALPSPLVVVSFSTTYMGQEELLRAVTAVLGDLPVRAVVTTGPSINAREYQSPPNVSFHGWLPHAELLQRARLVITHGGHGTVSMALTYGVPLLCLPLGRDQSFIADRVQALGVGVHRPQRSTREELLVAINALLQDGTYRENARQFGAHIRAEGPGADNAVREIEALV